MRLAFATLAVVLQVAIAAPRSARAGDEPKCPGVGDKAPPFALLMSDGRDGVSLRKALEKKVPVVLIFWAYHCVPCAKELPMMQELSDKLAGKVSFVLVHVGPDEEKMFKRLGELGVKLQSASDDTQKKNQKYCVKDLPVSFLINKEGVVAARFGEMPADEIMTKLKAELAKLGVTP